jgi:phosphoglycolate phosphatase-like HAD superfamily hydrolase
MSLPISWDEFGAYLFDIDGTLLHCADAVHYFAFCDALSNVAGRAVNLDGVTAHGNTDVGILRDAFALAGIEPSQWRPRLPELCAAMCRQVEEHKSSLRVKTLPLAREVLIHLRNKGALLSVATGNLERIGKQKLAAAGLLELFHVETWSDAFEYREDVFRCAVARIRARAGSNISIAAIGDTPADITAAHAAGIPSIAVATGIYSYGQLTCKEPSLCIQDFAELLEQTRSTTCSNSSAR